MGNFLSNMISVNGNIANFMSATSVFGKQAAIGASLKYAMSGSGIKMPGQSEQPKEEDKGILGIFQNIWDAIYKFFPFLWPFLGRPKSGLLDKTLWKVPGLAQLDQMMDKYHPLWKIPEPVLPTTEKELGMVDRMKYKLDPKFKAEKDPEFVKNKQLNAAKEAKKTGKPVPPVNTEPKKDEKNPETPKPQPKPVEKKPEPSSATGYLKFGIVVVLLAMLVYAYMTVKTKSDLGESDPKRKLSAGDMV